MDTRVKRCPWPEPRPFGVRWRFSRRRRFVAPCFTSPRRSSRRSLLPSARGATSCLGLGRRGIVPVGIGPDRRGIRRQRGHQTPRLGSIALVAPADSAQASSAASTSAAWRAARARMTVSWVGQSRAAALPAARKMNESTAGSADSCSAGAVLAIRIVGSEESACEGAQSSSPGIPRGNAPSVPMSLRARPPAPVGVQVVAGSNPVAPTS
jgi:hypothetical protein